MQQQNILIIVKQETLFKVFQHILASHTEIKEINQIKSWRSFRNRINSGILTTSYDVVVIEVIEADQIDATRFLRAVLPQAKLILLTFEPKLAIQRRKGFDAVLAKDGLVCNLLPSIRRVVDPRKKKRVIGSTTRPIKTDNGKTTVVANYS